MKAEPKRCTAHGNLVKDTGTGVPTEDKKADGQFADHYVLCPEDRAKGYVEPYRETYIHVGAPGPKYPLRDLTDDEHERYDRFGYIKFEAYPPDGSITGRFWTQERLDKVGKGCGQLTRMPKACAETYAAQPSYYGSTFCCGCGDYFPVGPDGEFVWDKATMQRVGTRLGSTDDRR